MVSGPILVVRRIPRQNPLKAPKAKFPHLTNLHLELLENKSKLKPGAPEITATAPKKRVDDDHDPDESSRNHSDDESVRSRDSSRKSATSSRHRGRERERDDTSSSASTADRSDQDMLDDFAEPEPDKERGRDRSRDRDRGRRSRDDDDDDHDRDHDRDRDRERSPSRSRSRSRSRDRDDDRSVDESKHEEPESTPSPPQEEDEFAGMTPEQIRNVILYQTKKLRKNYPNQEIPEFNEFADVQRMITSYKRTIKEIKVQENAAFYKKFLALSFVGIEYGCKHVLGLDMTGFARQQNEDIDSYNAMLIELGEQSYSNWFSNFPVEVRLLGMILLNAVLFFIGKYMTSQMGPAGSGLTSLMYTMFGKEKPSRPDSPGPEGAGGGGGSGPQSPRGNGYTSSPPDDESPPSTGGGPRGGRHRMKGPSISLKKKAE